MLGDGEPLRGGVLLHSPGSLPTLPRGPGPRDAHPALCGGQPAHGPPKTGLCWEGSGANGKIVFPFLVFFKLFWNSWEVSVNY